MVVDKFYFKNYVDKWCKVYCNLYDYEQFKVMWNQIFSDGKKNNNVVFIVVIVFVFRYRNCWFKVLIL